MTNDRDYYPQTARLVQSMHDSLCTCGGWCAGAGQDFDTFVSWVGRYWGSVSPLETYLEEMNDNRP